MVGATVEWTPDRAEFIVHASGGGSVSIIGKRASALEYKLAIDKLPIRNFLKIRFLSEKGTGISSALRNIGIDALEHHLLGQFQYQFLGRDCVRKFLVPLEFDPEKRLIKSLPCIDDDGTTKIMVRSSW